MAEKMLTKEIAEEFLADDESVDLEEFTELDDDAAESLSKYEWGLYLRGLTSLSDAAAQSLSKHEGELELTGLTSLSDAAAESLSKHKGDFLGIGLTSLSDATAELLSKHEGDLALDALTSLSDAAAESLSKREGGLDLNGLTSLTIEAASFLSSAGALSLDGLTELTHAIAKQFATAGFNGLSLNGLSEIAEQVAQTLGKFDGDLGLDGLKNLSEEAARGLGRPRDHSGYTLHLDGLIELPDRVAGGLSAYTGTISLNGLMELSDGAVTEFANDECAIYHLSLTGLTTLSDWAAKELVTWKRGGSGPSLYWTWSNLPASTADILDNPRFAPGLELKIVGSRMALVPHLGDHSAPGSQVDQALALTEGVRQRLLHIDRLAQRHRQHRGTEMGVIGSGNQYGINLIRHLLQHHTEIRIGLCRGRLLLCILSVPPFQVHVTERGHPAEFRVEE